MEKRTYEVVTQITGYVVERLKADSPEQAESISYFGAQAVMGHAFMLNKSSKVIRVSETLRGPAKSWANNERLFNDVPELEEVK